MFEWTRLLPSGSAPKALYSSIEKCIGQSDKLAITLLAGKLSGDVSGRYIDFTFNVLALDNLDNLNN